MHENNNTIFDVHVFNIDNLITSGRRHLMDRALRFPHPFNGHSLPTVGVVDPDDRRSSLLNSHEVVIRSIGKRPGKLLVFRHSWNCDIVPFVVGFGKPWFHRVTCLFAVLGDWRRRWRYRGIRVNVPCCSFIISLTILEPRLKTPGLGDRPSVARHFGELENEAEDGKIQEVFYNMSCFELCKPKMDAWAIRNGCALFIDHSCEVSMVTQLQLWMRKVLVILDAYFVGTELLMFIWFPYSTKIPI